jgi:ribonuclease P protein component
MVSVRAWQLSVAVKCSPCVVPRAESAFALNCALEASLRLMRLKKRKDFLYAASNGRKCVTHSVVLQAIETPENLFEKPVGSMRVGFTATKKLGNAVIRNRAKRRMRAVAGQVLPQYGRAGTDYVLIGRSLCVQSGYDTLCRDLIYALKKVHP